jgi:hypothetical protein
MLQDEQLDVLIPRTGRKLKKEFQRWKRLKVTGHLKLDQWSKGQSGIAVKGSEFIAINALPPALSGDWEYYMGPDWIQALILPMHPHLLTMLNNTA